MRTWFKWTGLMMLVALVVTTSLPSAVGQEKKKETEKQKNARFMGYLTTATDLIQYGEDNKSPEALVTAAGMLLEVHAYTNSQFEKLNAAVEDEKGQKVDAPDADVKSLKDQAADLFDKALTMGGPDLNALIKAVKERAKGTRAVKGGPKRISKKIQAGGDHHYNIPFISDQVGSIALQSDFPVRFVVKQDGVGVLFNSVVRAGHYTWQPSRAKRGTMNIKVEVHGMGHTAAYTIYAN